MSYKEKRTLVSIISGAILLFAYCFFAINKINSGIGAPDDLKFWATAILTFIGIGVAVNIIIQILFHILLSISMAVKTEVQNEIRKNIESEVPQRSHKTELDIEKTIALEMVVDEMDKLIELKSLRIGFALSGVGFVAALVSQILNYSPALMLNIIFVSFSLGSMIEGFVQLYYYKRGVYHG